MKLCSFNKVARAARAPVVLALVAVMASWAFSPQASAQSYPNRRVTFVVPYPAGGATDVSARLLATKLSDAWK